MLAVRQAGKGGSVEDVRVSGLFPAPHSTVGDWGDCVSLKCVLCLYPSMKCSALERLVCFVLFHQSVATWKSWAERSRIIMADLFIQNFCHDLIILKQTFLDCDNDCNNDQH